MEDDLTRRKSPRGKTGKTDGHKGSASEHGHGSESHRSESATIERRLHPRVPVSWPVRLWVDSTAVAGRTVDVSERGLCIVISSRTPRIAIGTVYRVDVIMGPKHEVSVTAEVRYVADAVVGLRTKQRLKLV
jgi:PilZ domain-containing protein